MTRSAAAKRFTAADLGPGTSLEEVWGRAPRRLSALGAAAGQGQPGALQAAEAAILKIKEIVAAIEDLRFTPVTDKVIVQGTVVEQVFFVDRDNIVRSFEERTPFSETVDLPGVDPEKVAAGTQRVEVTAEIEFIVAHLNETGTAVINKVVVLIDAMLLEMVTADGVIFDQIVSQAHKQVLVVKTKVPPPPPPPPPPPVIGEQVLVVAERPLPAIKLKRVDAEVRDLSATALSGKALVQGTVHKQVAFVSPDNVVRFAEEDVPFSHVVNVPGLKPGDRVTAQGQVEFLIPELDVGRGVLKQKIVLVLSVTR